ncbi:hypothetical protein [Streptomyces sp. NRRL F-5123]|uniref:hypothetical protein n=1 Tax=Streptomyces sp. NRRL F-5123 TaxID=1463856 RepID=UPI00131D6FF9|nr:hypothetical protein [Streptomyces sp. NRRL F-5123]
MSETRIEPSRLEPSWRAPRSAWNAPVNARAPFARVPTAYGEYTLFREPGRRVTFVAVAEAWENWQVVLGEEVLLRVDDAAPSLGLRKSLRHGLNGTLDGVPFTVRAAGRSLLASRRGLHFELDDGRTLSFTVHGFHRHLTRRVGGEDRLVLRSRGDAWETDGLDRGEWALLCFVVLSDAEGLLSSPLWDVL